MRAVCEFDDWYIPSASPGDAEDVLQVAMLQTAAGDNEIFIYSEREACETFQQSVASVVDFQVNKMPGYVALHSKTLRSAENTALTRIRLDHGEPHSFTLERKALGLVEYMADVVLVERTLAALMAEGDIVADIGAVLDFDFHVLCCQHEGQNEDSTEMLTLMDLSEVTGNPDHSGVAAAFTAPDHTQVFLADDNIRTKDSQVMAKMKGVALFRMLQIEQTNARTQGIAFNAKATMPRLECDPYFSASDTERLFGNFM